MRKVIIYFTLVLVIMYSCKKQSDNYPKISDQTFQILENSPNGTIVDTVHAASNVVFLIVEGNTDIAFGIDNATGVISVHNSSALDYESNPEFNLTIQITDVNTKLKNTAHVVINLIDETVTDSGLVAFYNFDDNGNDYTSNNNPAEGHNVIYTTYIEPHITLASFLEDSNYLNLPLDFDYPSRTISLWFFIAKYSTDWRNIFTSDHPNLKNSSSMVRVRDIENNLASELEYSVGGEMNDVIKTKFYAIEWNHVAMTINPDSVNCFLNGELIGTLPFVNYHSESAADFNTLLGCDRYATGGFFQGDMDDVKIFNRDLKPEEIRILYREQ